MYSEMERVQTTLDLTFVLKCCLVFILSNIKGTLVTLASNTALSSQLLRNYVRNGV